ncbi:PilC/PilY family type IV pilus protein [Thermocrinis sp.]|uniref:pilus assembly protein n=1 Tax=Thermocrinis sp. TaxID=2024383 RepID=UPI002FDE4118
MRRILLLCLVVLISFSTQKSYSASMSDYCYIPPTVGTSVPPIVMLVMGRDHKIYYEAYNDASDLDGDGRLDVGYKHSIDYYGYFDPYKCYRYEGIGANAKFVPTRRTNNKYCGGTNEWSGNFLNWLTMARIDVIRKVLYGGFRSTDSVSETVLEATYIPQDAHSWGKEYAGADTRQLTPFDPPLSGKRHLFCITSTSMGDTRKIRVALNDSNRIWNWASSEKAVCSGPGTSGGFRQGPVGTRNDIQDYYIRVKVCDPSVGLEENCKRYPAGTYKPIGLLQKYGEYEGGGKWCSKSLKPCNTDSDCNTSTDGLCVDRAKMYFGLLTGSYTKNLSGGVLRKNIWTIQDELNPNTGIFQTLENVLGNIILTLNRMTVVGFRYSDYSYQDPSGGSCGWITNAPLSEGQCRMWGNPIAEMMYEAVRYLAGKSSPTSDFTYSGTQDSGLNLPKPDWGIRSGSTHYKPYDLFPICSKPFVIVFSDPYPSYDSDKLPGSAFGGLSGDLIGLNVSTLANTISTSEGITGNYFIGQSGSFYDFICSSKSVSSLSTIRGLCPEEPTKQGSYYSASIAYYANTMFRDNFTGRRPPNLKTYSVVLSSPIPDIAIKVGDREVRIAPLAKSVSGCIDVFNNCFRKCTVSRDGRGNLTISGCSSNAFCPTNQIVDFYVEQVDYDSSGNLTYAKFRINFEDVEQGADHDMDAVVLYEIRPIGTNQIEVKLTSEYAAGCIDQVLGFFISGTTEDGQWLVVKDKDVPNSSDGDTPSVVANMPLTWSRTFTVSGTTARQLKDPLWYAAKWGGFDDVNGNNVPDLQSEWDKDGNSVPDTYFFVANPTKIEESLTKVFSDILSRASSGATVATLTSRASVSSVIVQPYFYPKYTTTDGKEISWIGFLRSFWVDTKQNLREDTITNKILNLVGAAFDKIFMFFFDASSNETKVAILNQPDISTSCSRELVKSFNEVIPVFDGGCALANTSAGDRRIYYNKNGTLQDFTTSEVSTLLPIFQTADSSITNSQAECIIRYIRGENLRGDPTCGSFANVQRIREFDNTTFLRVCPTYGGSGIRTWKLGDIVNSTPSVTGAEPNNVYHLRYGDSTYLDYIRTTNYRNRTSFMFVGANDGMLHAFRIGFIKETGDPNNPIRLVNSYNDASNNQVGKEEWAFIPKNALPYLVWYGRSDYCRVPTVDYRTFVFDASIGGPANSPKNPNSWRTVLIGTMGFGGKALGSYSSSVFALDLTDWLNGTQPKPTLLWEVSLPDQTLTISFPAVIRLGDRDKNGEWYVVIGTGPRDPAGESFTNLPKLYFIDLRTGGIVKTIDIPIPGDVNAAVGDISVVDVDSDYQDDVIYFGVYGKTNAGNTWGNFYRLSLRSGSNYKMVGSLASSDVCNVVDLGTFETNQHTPPVFGAPNFTKDENGRLWVFFGTGRYLSQGDRTIPYKNYFIGFKDDNWDGTACTTYRKNNLENVTNSTTAVTVSEVKQLCFCDSTGCGMKNVVYNTYYSGGFTEPTRGWYHELTGEGIYSQPLVLGGIVDALTFVPSADICQAEGSSNLIAVYYKNGKPYPRPSVLSPAAISGPIIVGQNVQILSKIEAGRGMPPLGNPFQAMQSASSSKGVEKFFQIGSGLILRISQQRASETEGRFILWIEK